VEIYFIPTDKTNNSPQLNDPESYAGGRVATGRASRAKHINGEDPDQKGYPGPPDWGLGHEAEGYTKILQCCKV